MPGIIGLVGTAFGGLGVNIAQMTVGRSAPGGDAIGVLNLDSEPSAEALAAVLACPGVNSVRVVKLPSAGQLPYWLAASTATGRQFPGKYRFDSESRFGGGQTTQAWSAKGQS